jgi:hypothetical protein
MPIISISKPLLSFLKGSDWLSLLNRARISCILNRRQIRFVFYITKGEMDMTKLFFLLKLGILLIGILFLVSCAPVATSFGTTPTRPPTDTPAPVVATAQSSTETPIPEVAVGIVEVDLLNMREGPGTNYPILSSLAKGEKFYILGEVVNSTSNKWLLVSPSADSLGWVIGDQSYVTVQKELVDLSTFLIWQKNMDEAEAILIALTPTPQ